VKQMRRCSDGGPQALDGWPAWRGRPDETLTSYTGRVSGAACGAWSISHRSATGTRGKDAASSIRSGRCGCNSGRRAAERPRATGCRRWAGPGTSDAPSLRDPTRKERPATAGGNSRDTSRPVKTRRLAHALSLRPPQLIPWRASVARGHVVAQSRVARARLARSSVASFGPWSPRLSSPVGIPGECESGEEGIRSVSADDRVAPYHNSSTVGSCASRLAPGPPALENFRVANASERFTSRCDGTGRGAAAPTRSERRAPGSLVYPGGFRESGQRRSSSSPVTSIRPAERRLPRTRRA
jgi:hypothetical protein